MIPICIFALLSGLILEYRRLTNSWQKVFSMTAFSFVLSSLAFAPGKHEIKYDFATHMDVWPFLFCLFFSIFTIAFIGDKIVTRLHEGISLLLSIAVIYWVLDIGLINTQFTFVKGLLLISMGIAVFSIYNAFSYKVLSDRSRLILSIWCSIIMLVFVADNFYSFALCDTFDYNNDLFKSGITVIQFFLLGVCCINIVNNFSMLAVFLPSRGRAFNDEYFNDVKNARKQHIYRFSDQQVSKLHSLICTLSTGLLFGLNYYYHFLPRIFLIWTVFFLYPIVLSAIYSIKKFLTKSIVCNSEKSDING